MLKKRTVINVYRNEIGTRLQSMDEKYYKETWQYNIPKEYEFIQVYSDKNIIVNLLIKGV